MTTTVETSGQTTLPYTKAETKAITAAWWEQWRSGQEVELNDLLKLPQDQFQLYLAGAFRYKDE